MRSYLIEIPERWVHLIDEIESLLKERIPADEDFWIWDEGDK